MGAERALRNLLRPHLDSYWSLCFERLCREALPNLYHREGVTGAFKVGAYWSKDTQIDLVGLREDDWIDLGECKWGPVRSPAAVEKELEEKVNAYPNPRGATIGRRIFARQERAANEQTPVQPSELSYGENEPDLDAEARFKARADLGSWEEGLRLLDELDWVSPEIRQFILDGMNTPIDDCEENLDW